MIIWNNKASRGWITAYKSEIKLKSLNYFQENNLWEACIPTPHKLEPDAICKIIPPLCEALDKK